MKTKTLEKASGGQAGKPKLRQIMSVPDMVVYGLIFMVPIAPFGIYGGIFTESGGMPTLVYIVGTCAMAFTALSYASLGREYPVSGSVYAYASRAIGPAVGFLTGWALMLDYILSPVLLYVVSSTALHGIVPEVPAWAFGIVFVVANTLVNVRGIETASMVNRIALVLEILCLAVFAVLGVHWIMTDPSSKGFSLDPVFNASTFDPNLVMSAVSLGVLSFLGFDGIATLAEEAKDARRGPGRAMMVSLAIVGTLFAVQTYIAGCISPDGAAFAHDTDNAFYIVAGIAGGKALSITCALATALSWGIFTALAAQTAISRILFAMGRDGNLPRVLSKIHPKYKTPYVATLFVGAVSLVLVLALGRFGTDTISLFVNFGALTAFLVLHVTVIWHFFIKKRDGKVFAHLISPLIGFAVIAYTWVSLSMPAKLLGISWVAIGIVYYLVMRKVLKREVTLA
ncbi:APC family permease [Raoultibacter timonensis]|uniref:APC family permease n=1 Tax=Raoultibacter timonensis TaxID=1907662 RepID=UPI000C8306D9|nr:APC family permease [Raoultibacter timonensis]